MSNRTFFFTILFSFAISTSIFGQHLEHVQGEILVQFTPQTDFQRATAQMKSDYIPVKLERVLSAPFGVALLSFDFSENDEKEILRLVRGHPKVRHAQFNHFVEMRSTIPNDPLFNQQWYWLNNGQNGGTPDADIDADLAWDLTTGGTTLDGHEIVVCIIEGANRAHPDLQGNLWVNEAEMPDDGIDNDGNGYEDDYEGWNVNAQSDFIQPDQHGTAVSGIIGAKGNNGVLVSGINWDVKIMHVDFANPVESDVVEAYTYPYLMRRAFNESLGAEGALVVATNASWGIDEADPDDFPIWCAVYDSLGAAGILNCVASTNDNVNVDVVGDMPGNCPSESVLCVTATDANDQRNFSGYGPVNVDVAAPGESVALLNLNGGPIIDSGTSYAAPVVSGLVALLYAAPCSSIGKRAIADPVMMSTMVRDAIVNGVDLIPNLLGELKTGGRVNAFNSMEILLERCSRCEQPFGLQVNGISESQAELNWTSTDSTLSTNLRWRMIGVPVWTFTDDVSTPYELEGLGPCTHYEFQLEDLCSDTSSGYTSSFVFETDGCCQAPQEVTISSITNIGATLSWTPVLAAQSYTLTVADPVLTFSYEGLTMPSFDLSGLQPCTDYEFTIEVVCEGGIVDLSPPFTFTTSGCGVCLDADYCISESENSDDEWIATVSLNDLNNSSTSDDGYGDYTSLSTDLVTWQNYAISIEPGYLNFTYEEWFVVWIDFNQDGKFDGPNEEVFNSNGTASTTVAGSILIPGDAAAGPTRMRVSMRFNTEPSSCDEQFNFGEVEDYCVNIIPGTEPDCQPPSGLDVPVIGNTFADLSWDETSGANGFEIRIRPLSLPVWTVISTTATKVTALNLEFCALHQFQVRSVCLDERSLWSPSANFQTGCFVSTQEESSGFHSLELWPNPAHKDLSIGFFNTEPGQLFFEMYGPHGQLVYESSQWYGVGEQRLVLNLFELNTSDGVHLLSVSDGRRRMAKKVMVLR